MGYVMTIFDSLRAILMPKNELPPPAVKPVVYPEVASTYSHRTKKIVTDETSKRISTAYRCANILSDDIASMPFQVFEKRGRNIERIMPDGIARNIAYLLEIQPNRNMVPLIFMKTCVDWLIHWGNAYIWTPQQPYREMFILRADQTYPVFDQDGSLWYKTIFPSGKQETIPGVEVAQLMINPKDGLIGRSVLTFARDTIGRQQGAQETQDRIQGNGLTPGGIIWTAKEVESREARQKIRDAYLESVSGSEHSGGVAVLDPKISKFEPVTMKPVDAQFLESILATDAQIANFYGMPLYKLNLGKQSYESNEQQNIDYLRTTLNPYLKQFEQVARVKWLRLEEQGTRYFRFNRDSLLQTDAKSRAEFKKTMIETGQMSPNEGRAIDDISPYAGGDGYYFPANFGRIQPDGSIVGGTVDATQQKV